MVVYPAAPVVQAVSAKVVPPVAVVGLAVVAAEVVVVGAPAAPVG